MLSVPPVAPATGGERFSARSAHDHYVRLDSSDYSVHPSVISWRIEVSRTWTGCGGAYDGKPAADPERISAWHQTVSEPAHLQAAKVLHEGRAVVLRPVREPEVELRCLADYDTALGIEGEEAS
jgi:hypothetical protein